MSDLGTAYVQVVPSAQGIKGALSKQFGAEGASAGQSAGSAMIGKMKGLIAGAAIGTTVVAGIKKAVGEGAALEQSMGGIETLFKNSANTVIANAKKAYKTAGMSANEYMENVTSFSAGLIKSLDGDTSKAAKVADTAMIDMSDNANKMGTDIGAIQNAYQGFAKQNYTMLDNLKLGYGGTKTEMERLLKDAGKISGQKYDMSNLSDVYEAIHVVQGELGITGTTAKEASETVSGSFSTLKASFSDFMGSLATGEGVSESMTNLINSAVTAIGGNLIPMIVQIFQSLPSAINAALQTASASFDMSTFKQVFSNGVDAIVNNVPQLVEQFMSKLSEIAPTIAEAGAFMLLKLAEGIIKALPTLISAAGQMINAILKVVVGLPALLIAKGLAAAGKFALGILKGANKIATAAGNWVKGIVNKVKSLPSMLAGWAMKAASGFGDRLKSGFKSAADRVKNAFTNIKDALLKPFNTVKDKIKGVIDTIKGFFPLNIGKIFSGMKLPHFNISGGKPPFGLGGLGTKPKIDVSWYAKGGIVTAPTLAFAGMGEKGEEAIVPLDPFWKKLDSMTGGNTFNITMNVDGAKNPAQWAREFSRTLEVEMRTI